MLRLFDFPDPNITSGARVETTVPLQQLFVLNSEFMVTSAGAVATRLQAASREPDSQDAGRIRQAYLLLYGRPATRRELELGLGYLHSKEVAAPGLPGRAPSRGPGRWQRYTQALLAANEFLFID